MAGKVGGGGGKSGRPVTSRDAEKAREGLPREKQEQPAGGGGQIWGQSKIWGGGGKVERRAKPEPKQTMGFAHTRTHIHTRTHTHTHTHTH